MPDSFSRAATETPATWLLRVADRGLLDEPLGTLAASLAESTTDDDLTSLLLGLDESGEATTLREACRNGAFDRWLDERSTDREASAALRRLRELVGDGAHSSDDATRLVTLGELPDDPEAIVRWAREHRVAHELSRPIDEVLAGVRSNGSLTLLEACFASSHVDATTSPLAMQALELEARAFLLDEAARTLAVAARRRLWSTPLPQGALGRLAERLAAYLGDTTLEALDAVRFSPSRKVTLDIRSGVVAGAVRADSGEPVAVELFLAGYEHRGLEGACATCRRHPCLHLRALAARCFDVCLDATDRLRGPIEAFVATPSWKGFVDSLTERAEPNRPSIEFIARFADGGVSIAPSVPSRKTRDKPKFVPAATLLRSRSPNDRDRTVLEAMVASARTFGTAFVPGDSALLRALVSHPAVRDEATGELVRVVEQTIHVEFKDVPGGVMPRISLGGTALAPGDRGARTLVVERDAGSRTAYFATLPPAVRRLLAAVAHYRSVLPEESYAAIAPFVASLREVARVSTPSAFDGLERPAPEKLVLRLVPRIDAGLDVSLVVRAFPLSPPYPPGTGPEIVHGLERGVRVVTRRDRVRERALADRVVDTLGVDEHPEIDAYSYRVDTTTAALELLARAARATDLIDLEWSEGGTKLRVAGQLRVGDVALTITRKGRYLALEGRAKMGPEEIPFRTLLDAARRGERFVRIGGGDFAEIERELFDRLESASISVVDHDHELAIALAAAPEFLRRIEGIERHSDAETCELLDRAQAATFEDVAIPSLLGTTLRDYQADGVRFLLRLARWAPGACLADEMGLGKTVQSIAVLAARRDEGPALVVAPTSMVSSWVASIERFSDALAPVAYRGPTRDRLLDGTGPGSVIVTSYDVLLRDIDRLGERSFSTLVIDEAQLVKNARTARSSALSSIDARFRIALTGTPIENRLGDLYGIFHLIAPELLGTTARFRSRFAVPIERYENTERANILRALIAPFLLRRTKDDVERELPSRTETVHLVELSPAERTLYDGAVRHAQAMLDRHFREKAGRSLEILAELTRLRQLACHPRLALGDTDIESSKLATFLDLFDDLTRRGHRLLVFSQFTSHLALVREALDAKRIAYLYLDGATPGAARGDLVARFQAGEGAAFLISLKAGGTGLDLTAADYVVHLDPWWNPAAEDQASDRAHRIGQTKPVTIVRLVARGTIEEQVLELHAQKRKLAAAILEGDAAGYERIELEEVREMLRGE